MAFGSDLQPVQADGQLLAVTSRNSMPAPTERAAKRQNKTGMTGQCIFLGQQINKRLNSVVSLSPHVEGHHNLELQSTQLEPPSRQ